MRSFTRLRTLAAASALAVFFAVSAKAAVSKMPDIPTPVEVGDPDEPTGNVPLILGGRVYLIRLPAGLLAPRSRQVVATGPKAVGSRKLILVRHAR